MHEAFLTPGVIRSQVAEMPDGSRYFSIARTDIKPGLGHNHPRSRYSLSIGCEISDAGQMVYADGLDLESPHSATPVGVACRLCDRADCAQRAAPSPQKAISAPGRRRNISPGIGHH